MGSRKTAFVSCHFKLITDCKPVQLIFNNPNSKPPARIERWNLRLQGYDFDIIHTEGSENPSDYLSRHPSNDTPDIQAYLAEEYVNFIVSHAVPIKEWTPKKIWVNGMLNSNNDYDFATPRDIVEPVPPEGLDAFGHDPAGPLPMDDGDLGNLVVLMILHALSTKQTSPHCHTLLILSVFVMTMEFHCMFTHELLFALTALYS